MVGEVSCSAKQRSRILNIQEILTFFPVILTPFQFVRSAHLKAFDIGAHFVEVFPVGGTFRVTQREIGDAETGVWVIALDHGY